MLRRAALAGALLALALAGSASADPGNGAEQITFSQCIEGGLGVLCFDEVSLTNSTENSNVTSLFIHTEGSSTFTGYPGDQAEGCTETQQYTTKSHSLVKTGEFDPQVQAIKGDTVTVVVNCFGSSIVCAFTNSYHYANRRLQYNRSEGSCEPQ
jgi:hypothetical protein